MEDILNQISKVKRDKLGTEIPILIFRVLRHYTIKNGGYTQPDLKS